MRFDFSDDGVVSAFTLTCPGYRSGRDQDGAASARGNLSFMIGNDVLAEIDHADLLESWRAAAGLSAAEAARMTEAAGHHLAEILDGGLATADLTEAVTDAAVVFLLAMKRYGISDPKRIPACTVMWHGQDGQGHVLLGA